MLLMEKRQASRQSFVHGRRSGWEVAGCPKLVGDAAVQDVGGS